MIAKSIAMGLVLMLVGCSRENGSQPPAGQPPAAQAPETPAVAEAKTEAATQKPSVPVVQYYDKADEFVEPFRPDLTIGVCLAIRTETQFKTYSIRNEKNTSRGSGLSPLSDLNNFLYDRGLDRVDIESGRVRVIRMPTHGKLVRADPAKGTAYESDPNYLGDDRLVLAAEVGGKKYEIRYYLHIVENYYGALFQEQCRQPVWKIGPGPPNRFEPPPAKDDPDAFHLRACRLVYTNDSAGAPVRNGLYAPLAVMARQQALLREWNDDQWKVRVTAGPQHGTLEPDTSLEANFFYTAEPEFTGLDRIVFEVSLGAETYQVEQLALVNSFDPDYEQNVPWELQSCEAFKLPGIPEVDRDEG